MSVPLLAGLVGCAHAPRTTDFAPPPTDVAIVRTWEAAPVIANLQALSADTSDRGELSPDEVLASAIAFNPRMRLARAQRDVGAAGVIAAREHPNPTLSLSPEHLLAAASGVSPWVLAVSVVWPMRIAGKRELAIEQAIAADDGASLNAAAVVWSLRTDARAAVCAAEFASAHRQLAEEEAAMRADLVARFEKQAEAGMVSRYEVARARLDRDASAQRLRQAEADVIAARHDIAALTGLPMSEVARRPLATRCIQPDVMPEVAKVADLESRAVGGRLDLRAKLTEFRAADAVWRSELAKRYPDLSLGPGYMYDQGDRKVTFSLAFELPIHSHNAGAIARARAERERVIAESEILQDSILAEVGKTSDRVLQAREQLAAARSILQQSQALLNRDLEREHAGEIDTPTVILSRIAISTARADELAAEKSVVDATAALEAATQRPLTAPEFDVDAAISLLGRP